uniref:Tubulointerstitial nephritis antigen like 1 n=1 Tax=Chelydra serpentina TaxID=8475 RepID=A0A8C3T4V8_CHESE
MRLLWTLPTLWLLAAEDLSAPRARSRRELAPGLHERGIRDAGGSYCERNDACCTGRDDACTVPYLDTICYCDLFCNRTVSDCCPDFWEYCLGIPPPVAVHKGCDRGGHKYPTGATYRENCNLCTCSGNGNWDCEQHACLIDGEMIDAINRGNYGWRAANYSHFWGMTLDEGVRYRLGTIKPPSMVMNMNELQGLAPCAVNGSMLWLRAAAVGYCRAAEAPGCPDSMSHPGSLSPHRLHGQVPELGLAPVRIHVAGNTIRACLPTMLTGVRSMHARVHKRAAHPQAVMLAHTRTQVLGSCASVRNPGRQGGNGPVSAQLRQPPLKAGSGCGQGKGACSLEESQSPQTEVGRYSRACSGGSVRVSLGLFLWKPQLSSFSLAVAGFFPFSSRLVPIGKRGPRRPPGPCCVAAESAEPACRTVHYPGRFLSPKAPARTNTRAGAARAGH